MPCSAFNAQVVSLGVLLAMFFLWHDTTFPVELGNKVFLKVLHCIASSSCSVLVVMSCELSNADQSSMSEMNRSTQKISGPGPGVVEESL